MEELKITLKVKLTEKVDPNKPVFWRVVQSVIDGGQHDLIDSVAFYELKTYEL